MIPIQNNNFSYSTGPYNMAYPVYIYYPFDGVTQPTLPTENQLYFPCEFNNFSSPKVNLTPKTCSSLQSPLLLSGKSKAYSHKSKPKKPEMISSNSKRSFLIKEIINNFKGGRNIIPNTVGHLISFLEKKTLSQKLLKKVFKKLEAPPEYSIERFSLYNQHFREKHGSFINLENFLGILCDQVEESSIFSLKEAQFYQKASRIVIRQYLGSDLILKRISSKKLHKEQIVGYLSTRRCILELIERCCYDKIESLDNNIEF